MIERFYVKNYKALRDVSVDLTPITVLIGPNDTGKTSLLEAIGALCRSVDVSLDRAFMGRWQNADLVWRQDATLVVSLGASFTIDGRACKYHFDCQFSARPERTVRQSTERFQSDSEQEKSVDRSGRAATVIYETIQTVTVPDPFEGASRIIHEVLSGVQPYRWQPEHLALPAALGSGEEFSMAPTGFGMARCLDDILGADRSRFIELEKRFTSYFPEIKGLQLKTESAYRAGVGPADPLMFHPEQGKGLHFVLGGDGGTIPASQASDGTLLVLAYLTVLYLPRPPRVLLIEEPENGIHPKRLQEVLRIVRELVGTQQHTQVVMTTHSPYVLDLFRPDEVVLCRKDREGAVTTTRLSESELVAAQQDIFTLGEIWSAAGDDALAGDALVAAGAP